MDDERIIAQNEFILPFMVIGIIFLCVMQYMYMTQRAKKRLEPEPSMLSIFILMAAAAFIIRMLIGYNMPGYITDMDCFRSWSAHAYEGGLQNFYNGDFFADYPPMYIYILSFLGFIRDAASVDIMSPAFGLMVRMPSLITDIILAAMVFFLAKREINGKMALFLSALILFNPAIMANDALWGQVDVLVTIFMVLTVYMLYKEKYLLCSVMFAIAFLFKPQAIMIAPLLLFVFVRNIVVAKNKLRPVVTLALAIGIFVGLFFLVPLPFGAGKEPLWLVERYTQTVGQYPQASLNAFNVFSLAGLNFLDAGEYSFLGLALNKWGFIFIAIICLYTLWLYIKKPDKRFLFALAALIVVGVFAFSHGMHERYLYVVPVLLLFAYIFLKDKRLITCTILTFGISLVNTCLALYFYQVWLPTEMVVILSAVAVAIFVYTIYVISMIALKPVQELKPREAAEGEPTRESFAGASAATRLEQFGAPKKYITGRDGLIMLVISAIYAVVAFTNLGATQIPSTSANINDDILYEFSQPEELSLFLYYPDYGEGEFEVYFSQDGENYLKADMTNSSNEPIDSVVHEKSQLYKWNHYGLPNIAKYVRIRPLSGDLPLLETAFMNAQGQLVTPTRVTGSGGEITALTDEQQLVPAERTYMTDFYFDELYHVRTAYENIHRLPIYEWTHPPLGKIIIASGIEMLGMNPFGWRFMGTLAGVLMLPVMYVLAMLMFKKRRYAVFATVLLAADFMHFAQTRIGTVDSFSVLWIMLMYLFMFMYTQRNFNRQPVKKTLLPLFLSGLFFGIGAATKWICIYAGVGLLVIFLFMMYRRYDEYRYAKQSGQYPDIVENYGKNLRTTLLCCVGFFILIPAAIYIASYAPYFMVKGNDAYTSISDIIDNQKAMLGYHANLDPEKVHPFASKWYTWPLDVRPVLFFSYQNASTHTIATLSTMGNPLLWWTGVIAAVYFIINAVRSKRHRTFTLLFLGIAALSQFAPWMLVTREVFIYHYFATVPFLILIVVYWLKYMAKDFKYGKQFALIFVIACVAMFAFFYPVITGVPADASYINGLKWLGSWPFY